jgi:hypothetical protein
MIKAAGTCREERFRALMVVASALDNRQSRTIMM